MIARPSLPAVDMIKKQKPPPKPFSSTEVLYGALCIVTAAVLVAFAVIYAYFVNFKGQPVSGDPQHWGQLGDFVGGLVNPVVGLATVILVFLTLILQRHELQASLAELKRSNESAAIQSFEQSFFSWLANYHSLLSSIEGSDDTRGRSALSRWYGFVLSPRAVAGLGERDPNGQFVVPLGGDPNEALLRLNTPEEGIAQLSKRLEYATSRFQALYDRERSNLDAVFRTFYRMIRWIDESGLGQSLKWHYVALARAQLSWAEQVFFFYNGLTHEGKGFVQYANKYALFDNLRGSDNLLNFAIDDFTNCPEEKRPNVLKWQPWPYERRAFSSAIAKQSLGLPVST